MEHRDRLLTTARIVACALTLALLVPLSAPRGNRASAAPASEEVLYQEDFEDGEAQNWNLPDKWEVERGADGEAVLHARGPEYASYTRGSWSDYSYSVRIKPIAGRVFLYYRIEGGGQCYWIGFDERVLDLHKTFSDGAERLLKSVSQERRLNRWYEVEITESDGKIDVYVDGTLRLSYTDSDPLLYGGIAIETPGTSEYFVDDIRITAPQAAEPPWEQTGGPTGAPMESVVISPANASVLYSAGYGGGVYKSTNGGETWGLQPIRDYRPEEQLRSLVLNPAAPDTLYVVGAHGVSKSTDGGATWAASNNGIKECQLRLVTLAMDPTRPDTLYIGTGQCVGDSSGVVYKSTDGGRTWNDITGQMRLHVSDQVNALAACGPEVYVGLRDTTGEVDGEVYHSSDGGKTWTQVDLGRPAGTYAYSAFVDRSNPREAWIGLGSRENRMFTPCLFVTRDGGQTWQGVAAYPGREEGFVVGKSPAGALYVSRWRTSDGGRTWETYFRDQHGENDPAAALYGLPVSLAFDPHNAATIYAALRYGPGVAKTINDGGSWRRINMGIINGNVSLIAADPSDSDTLLASGIGGVGTFRTVDGGAEWTWVSGNGITHPFGDELAFRVSSPGEVWQVADVGRVFVSTDTGVNWSETINPRRSGTGFRYGSIYALATAPSNSAIIYALKNGFGIYRSRDGGSSWTFLENSEIDYSYSIAVHPSNPNVIFSGFLPKPFQDFGMVRRTTDGGDSWDTILTVPNSTGVASVAIDVKHPDTVYAGSVGSRGEIYKTANGGETWARLNEQFTMLTVWGQPQLVADPRNESIVYITTWLGGTWKSSDAGSNWTLLKGAPLSGTAISIDPRSSRTIYLADRTAPKVWRSTDAGASWVAVGDFGEDGAFLVNRVLADGESLYAATFGPGIHSGRLYRSSDSGTTWKDITSTLPRSVLDIAPDPNRLDTIYVTTHVHGAFKSTDGGSTWTEMASFPDIGAYDIEVDPVDTRILYACGLGGQVPSWCMPPDGYTFRDPAGVYKSTDAGQTWTSILATSNECRAIRIHPRDHNVLFAAALDDGLQISTDGGHTWKNCNTGLGTKVLTSCAIGGDKVYVGTQGCGVYSGDVQSAKWTVSWQAGRSNKPVPETYSMQIQVDPTNSNRIFVGANPGGLFRSDDGGATFYDKNFLTPSVVVSEPHRQGYYTYALNPTNTAEVWLGTWGKGVYKSYDGMDFDVGANGTDRIMFGKHVNSLLVDPRSPNTVYAATEEGMFRTKDGGVTWSDFSLGLGTRQVRTLSMPSANLLICGTLGYELYSINPQITSSGYSWRQLGAFDEFGVFWPIWNNRPLYQYTALLFHPTDPNVIYCGTFPAGIYVSRDGGTSWQESNPGWPNDGVFSLAFCPTDMNRIFVGTYNGLMVSANGGSHWEVRDEGWPAQQWVFSIAFDPRAADTMYACSKNGENEGAGREGFHGTVMKSTDGGATWNAITSGLDLNQEFYKILVDPHLPDVLYLATQRSGVFVSRNGGEEWSAWNTGLTNMAAGTNGNNVTNTMTFSADGQWVYFGTAGSGVFRRMTVGNGAG
jgi:photosystem II stability/assembly factor-like uncharacterized protein